MILIFTDTSEEQVNGVQVTLNNLKENLLKQNINFEVVDPKLYKKICTIHSTKIVYVTQKNIKKIFDKYKTENLAVHILTEGPIGLAANRYCHKNNIKFTTSILTFWDSFFYKNFFLPKFITNKYMKWFHSRAEAVMVSSVNMSDYADSFNHHIVIWPKGVKDIFRPYDNKESNRALFVGRISKEKDIEDFLDLKIPHKKIVVGDGPLLKSLKLKYPDVEFKGLMLGEALAREYSKASVFVFPSKFDTFGLVIIEALSCGTPVASNPSIGPSSIINDKKLGCLNEDLVEAIEIAEKYFDINYCLEYCKQYKWSESCSKFLSNLVWNDV